MSKLTPQELSPGASWSRLSSFTYHRCWKKLWKLSRSFSGEFHRQDRRCDSGGTTPNTNHPDSCEDSGEPTSAIPDRVVDVPVVMQQEMSPESRSETTDRTGSRNEMCGVRPCGGRSLCRVHVEPNSGKTNEKVMWRKAEIHNEGRIRFG